jgi:hypothetical protein
METWTHGQNVFNALRRERTFTDRLRHIAHPGVTTFGWSYINRGLDVPQIHVREDLGSSLRLTFIISSVMFEPCRAR